ncbi:MAG TPA: hypothetical protein ENJ43_03200 [Gammaproteobacteria bacterium]|nr:hypothetical protein [Gammaproteobacteria bacterium]
MDPQVDLGAMSATAGNPVQGQSSVQVPAAEAANPSTGDAFPDPWWWIAGALLVLLVLVYRWRRSRPDPDRFERKYELPVRAVVPRGGRQHPEEEGLLAVVAPDDVAVQGMRSLRTALHLSMGEGGNRVVAILSRRAGAGCSFVAANLAAVLAEGGKRVLLLDGDLRNGSLHRQFGLADGCGLAELLSGDAGVGSVICGTGVKRLELIPAGGPPANPEELLGGRRFALLLQRLGAYDHIVIDTSPLATGDGALAAARLADVALMVVKGRRGAGPGIARLRHEKIALHGVVFNRVRLPARRGRDGRRFGYA